MNVEDIPDKLREVFESLQLGLVDLRTQVFSKPVVLEIHDSGLRGAVIDRKSDPIEVPLPPGVCSKGQPREIEAIGDLLGDLCLELGLAGARVSACLPLEASRWQVVRWPSGRAPTDGRAELRLRAPDLGMPWPLNDVYLEVEPLPDAGDRSLVVAAPRDLVDSWVQVFELAGLQLERLLPAQVCEWQMLADHRVAADAAGEELWLLDLGRSHARLWIVAGGLPVADWLLPGQRSGVGLDSRLEHELQRRRRFWRQHSGGSTPRRWLVYGADGCVTAAQGDLETLLAPDPLQRWQLPTQGGNLDLRLSGLKHSMTRP